MSGSPLNGIELIGGLIAVELDSNGALVPRAGWYARWSEGSISQVLAEIENRHIVIKNPVRSPVTASNSTEELSIGARNSGTARLIGVETVLLRNRVRALCAGSLEVLSEQGVVLEVHQISSGSVLSVSDGNHVLPAPIPCASSSSRSAVGMHFLRRPRSNQPTLAPTGPVFDNRLRHEPPDENSTSLIVCRSFFAPAKPPRFGDSSRRCPPTFRPALRSSDARLRLESPQARRATARGTRRASACGRP